MNDDALDLFVNPIAGRGRAKRRIAAIEALFREAGVNTNTRLTTGVRDLEATVAERAAAGAKAVVIVGGDGSIHEAVNGLLTAGTHTALGIVPCGTGNDFAKAAEIPLDWRTATMLLADRIAGGAPARHIDAGRMNGRYFANGAGVGLDAKITAIAHGYRLPIGDLVYLVAIFRALLDGIATPELVIRGESFEHRGPLTLANVASGPWVGGMFPIAPDAKNDDGAFDLVYVDPVTRRRVAALLPKLMRGEHLGEPEIHHRRTQRLTIESAEPTPWHLDGEAQPPADYFEVEVLAGALRLA